ncbi:zf-HC2 domain-containing protein [Paenibacillus elgii]|uniref:zf-HC2 domain-containing protein n=1 Tax=Paenibacillus elgii TaxID=189691 RepID=UPI00203DC80E|nr:zf-HC2 domain-containing protein [Paenibacillus elgii]MCM3269202.1 zf-HC2 domain-containing protein [Paenibacillus elgii]
MKCDDVYDFFGVYWDLPEDDPNRLAVDEHIKNCPACAEEFQIWQESTELIRTAGVETTLDGGEVSVSSSVMKRIYEDESWRVPVGDRLYQFSYKLRRNLTAVIACFIALFMVTFYFSFMNDGRYEAGSPHESAVFGRMNDPVVAVAGQSDSMNVHAMPTAVASLRGFSDPFMYQVGPIRTINDYMLFVSLFGLTGTLLIMNWFSRTRQ